jgi:hypothetical protein
LDREFEVNGKQVAMADLEMGMPRDLLVIVRAKDTKPGDSEEIRWTDNKGKRGGGSTTLG